MPGTLPPDPNLIPAKPITKKMRRLSCFFAVGGAEGSAQAFNLTDDDEYVEDERRIRLTLQNGDRIVIYKQNLAYTVWREFDVTLTPKSAEKP